MKCNLVILNYNDSYRAFELAKKTINFNNIDRVVIVDNKSTDNSLEYLKERVQKSDKIQIVEAKK